MAKTQILGRQLKDGTIGRADLNTTVSGDAVVTKIIGSNGLAVALSTGVDDGTGDVTLATDLIFLNSKYPSLDLSRSQNHVFAGPAVGNGNPSFRALVAGDIPTIAISGVSGLQTALDFKLSGFGSTNRLTKYLTAGTLGNSQIYDDGVNVGVGHTSPSSMLDVNGTLTLRNTTIAHTIIPAVNVNGFARSLMFTYNSSATTEGFSFKNIYNNTDLLFINGGGNVGIGTTTPTLGKLQINGITDNSGVGIALAEVGGQGLLKVTNTGITMERPAGSNANLALITTAQSYGATGGGIVFQTNGVNVGKITKEGNFGVGNTAPTYRLDVSGNGRFTGDVTFDANAVLATSPTTNNHLTNKFYVDSKVWTIAAVSGLQTALDIKLSGFGATNRVSKYTTAGTLGNSQIYDDGTSVAVGHTSPASRLDIDGTLTLRSGSIVANSIVPAVNVNGTERSMRFVNLSTTNNEGFQFWHGVNGNLMFIANSGNVGIGTTTPTLGKLQINGITDNSGVGIALAEVGGQGLLKVTNTGITMERPAGSNANLAIITTAQSYGATGGGIVFQTNGVNVGKITKEGNFGVGNTAPTYRLDVSGNGRFTGSVLFETIPLCAANATSGNHLVNLNTLMAYASGIKYDTLKVRTVAMGNITLSGHQTISGYTTSGSDRVLVMGQATASQNGVYISGSGTWVRDTNFDTDTEIRGAIHTIDSGTYAGYKFINANTTAITVGTSTIAYTEFSSLVETDPVFTASAAYNVTSTKISNWDTAFSWGNHASMGYGLASSISGTTNRLAKFTSAGVVGNSQIFDDGTNVAIGHTLPASKLDIDGTLTLRSGSIVTSSMTGGVSVNGTARSFVFNYNSSATNEGFLFRNINAGTNLLFVRADGNVGIGNTAPAYKIDVTGTGRFTADVLFGADINITGKIRLNGSTGVDHQFIKFNGTNTEWAYMNTGELQDKNDIVMLTTDTGERGFKMYLDNTNAYANAFIFSNQDTGLALGLHAYAVDGSDNTKEFGLQIDADGFVYHKKIDGSRSRLATVDMLSGSGSGGGSYSGSSPISVANNIISIATANSVQSGALSAGDWNTFNNKLSDGAIVKAGLNFQGYGFPENPTESKLTFSRQEYPSTFAEMFIGHTPFLENYGGTVGYGMNIVAKNDTKLRIGSISGPLELFGNGIYLNTTRINLPPASSLSLNQRLVFKVTSLSGGIYTLGLETA